MKIEIRDEIVGNNENQIEVGAQRGKKSIGQAVPYLYERGKGKGMLKLSLPKLKILITVVGCLLARNSLGNMYWYAPSSIFIRPYLC